MNTKDELIIFYQMLLGKLRPIKQTRWIRNKYIEILDRLSE